MRDARWDGVLHENQRAIISVRAFCDRLAQLAEPEQAATIAMLGLDERALVYAELRARGLRRPGAGRAGANQVQTPTEQARSRITEALQLVQSEGE